MSIILVCEIEIELPTQTFRGTETCQCSPATFINKIATGSLHYINQQRGGQLLFKSLNSNLHCL